MHTETHLRPRRVGRLGFPNYHVVASYCGDPVGRIGGGVLISAGMAEACSSRIYQVARVDAATLLPGIGIPPELTRDIRVNSVAAIRGDEGGAATNSAPSHLLSGDLYVTTWLETFEVWRAARNGILRAATRTPQRA